MKKGQAIRLSPVFFVKFVIEYDCYGRKEFK
jgi:hypothetical protein